VISTFGTMMHSLTEVPIMTDTLAAELRDDKGNAKIMGHVRFSKVAVGTFEPARPQVTRQRFPGGRLISFKDSVGKFQAGDRRLSKKLQ
jgi:hypothetical protein